MPYDDEFRRLDAESRRLLDEAYAAYEEATRIIVEDGTHTAEELRELTRPIRETARATHDRGMELARQATEHLKAQNPAITRVFNLPSGRKLRVGVER